VPKPSNHNLTPPDLVVLSYLSQEAMHGYQLNQMLELHEAKDWAGISRPQVYYSLKKLKKLKLIKTASDENPAAGPDRVVFDTTEVGVKALAEALERDEWATQRPPPPFLTWMVLSRNSRSVVLRKLLSRRREFLRSERERERATLGSFPKDDNRTTKMSKLIVSLCIQQFDIELRWLDDVEKAIGS
jgi:DNA-binding PadR family transcriptional regulator